MAIQQHQGLINLLIASIFILSSIFVIDYFSLGTTEISKISDSINDISQDPCILPDRDPWDPTISKFFRPKNNRLAKCVPETKFITSLRNGQLIIQERLPENSECYYRCLLPKTDFEIIYQSWIKFLNGTQPKCDIVEVHCRYANSLKPFYRFLHAQVFRFDSPSLIQQSPEKYDVHLIVIDSVSHSQFLRSMVRTSHLLDRVFKAIPFPSLNKIGLNSRPNAFGFLMGKAIFGTPKSPFSRGYPSDYPDIPSCKVNLDKDQFIGFRFQDDGYVTLMSEDWKPGSLAWPNCKGFNHPPADHYMAPFRFHLEKARLLRTLYDYSCRETYEDNLGYLKSFIKAYPDKPKFSITWLNDVAHNNPDGLYHVDNWFYRFFNESRKEFDNSFIFLMADHGMRFGPIRKTKLGNIEDNNPLFYLTVPKKLRQNEILMSTLRTNADQLITHYDIYATLADIAKPKYPRFPNPLLKGNSLFHPLPQPRNCETLQIPDAYCLCEKPKTLLPKNNGLALPLSQYAISQFNQILATTIDTKECAKLSLNEAAEIEVIEFQQSKNPKIRIFQITFTTLPGNGQHEGFVSRHDNGTIVMVSEKFTRLDSYDRQSKCAIGSQYRNYCYCKNLLIKNLNKND